MKTNQQGEVSEKKSFDKKKWRERKYSHKFKVQQFEDRRKKKVVRNYYKELKYFKGKPVEYHDDDANDEGSTEVKNEESQPQPQQDLEPKRKLTASQQARLEFERIQKQKEEKKLELEQKKAEKEQKLQDYKTKKAEKFKKLSKKTRKGQPVMKDRLEMLLEKIQRQCK